jgi:hypothetical protein
MTSMNILVGTLIYQQGAYILDKFLANQKQMQENFPHSELVLATAEKEFAAELESTAASRGLRVKILSYDTHKPASARSNIWNITSGREAIRQYMLFRPNADALLFLDADMTYDPQTINIMTRELEGYQVIFCGTPMKDYGTGMAGAGCVLLKREILEKISFRCYEFKNGEVINEDNVLEADLFKLRSKVKKGYFISMDHYIDATKFVHLDPQKAGILRTLSNNVFLRYCLIKASIFVHFNIPVKMRLIMIRLVRVLK